jgi:hypothetical protein
MAASDALDAVDAVFIAQRDCPSVHLTLSCPPDKETELPFEDIEVPVAMQ